MTDQISSMAPLLMLQPMVHVQDMAASVAFYEQLGGSIIHGDRDEEWVLMQVGCAQIGLLATAPDHPQGTVELNFHSELPLEELQDRLRAAHLTVTGIADDPTLGRQLQVKAPDGMVIKINQAEPAGYV